MLNGRVVALDLILSTAGASPQVLWLIGIYAPSAASHDANLSFWTNILSLITFPPLTDLWVVIGDFNQTLTLRETSSGIPHANNLAYQEFLVSTNVVDLWMQKHPFHINVDYTLKSYMCGAKSTIDVQLSPLIPCSLLQFRHRVIFLDPQIITL